MEWLAPSVAGLLALITGVTVAIITVRGGRSSNRENRAPDVTDSWAEADRARTVAWRALDLVFKLRSAFRSYFLRVSAGGSLELTVDERHALEAEPPTLDPTPKEKA